MGLNQAPALSGISLPQPSRTLSDQLGIASCHLVRKGDVHASICAKSEGRPRDPGRRLAESIRTLTTVPQLLQAKASKQSDRVKQQLAAELIRMLPIDELRRVTTGNLRLGELERAGWTTVGQYPGG